MQRLWQQIRLSGIPDNTGIRGPMSFPNFEYLQKRSHSFSAMAAFAEETFTLTGLGEPSQLDAARVSWNFFRVLGVRPVLGRAFLPDEDCPGGRNVVLISHSLWTNRFAASPRAIGQSITLNDWPYTIVGVLPAAFVFPFLGPRVDIWKTPLARIPIPAIVSMSPTSANRLRRISGRLCLLYLARFPCCC